MFLTRCSSAVVPNLFKRRPHFFRLQRLPRSKILQVRSLGWNA